MIYEAKWDIMVRASDQIGNCAGIIKSVKEETAQIKNTLYLTGSPSVLHKIKKELQNCVTSLESCYGKTVSVENLLSESANIYKTSERKIVGLAPQATANSPNGGSGASEDGNGNSENGETSPFSFLGLDTEKLTLLFGSVVAYLAKTSGSYENGLFSAEGNVYAGKAYADWGAKLNILDWKEEYEKFKNGEVKQGESIFFGGKLEGKAGVAVLSADGNVTYGTDALSIGLAGEGDLLTAYAEGGVKIGGTYKDGKWTFDAVAKGEAMVAAAKGEVKGTVNILGIKITPKVGGYAGAAGLEGKVGYEQGEGFVIEGGAAAGLGAKVGVAVDFDVEAFIDSMEDIGSAAADVWDVIVFWD